MRKLLIFVTLLLLSVIVTGRALADEGCNAEYRTDPADDEVSYDPDPPYFIYPSHYVQNFPPFTFTLVLPDAVQINALTLKIASGDEDTVVTATINGNDYDYDLHGYPEDGSPFQVTQSIDEVSDTIVVTADQTLLMYSFNPTCGQTWVKPLDSENQDDMIENLNQLSTDADNAVFAFSFTPGANVHTAAAGTITAMHHINPDEDCDQNFNRADIPLYSFPCMLLIPDESQPMFPDGGRDETAAANTYLVRLFADSGHEFTYFVADADRYLEEGQTVTAGCVMGQTMQVEGGFNPPEYLSEPGMTIVNMRQDGAIAPLLASLSIEPEADAAACNIPPGDENENCMGDVLLNDPAEWETSSGVTFNEPGFTILGGFDAHIRTSMNLDPLQKPELIVRLRATGGGNGNFTLTIGQTTEEFSISESAGYQDVSIAGAEHDPDGTFYTIRVLNDGTSTLDIQSVCVRFTDDGGGNPIDNPDPPTAACIFTNHSFDSGDDDWTVASGETGPGEIRLQSTGTISQNVTLSAGTYDVTVVAALWHYSSYSPDDQDSDDVDLEYSFDGGFTALDSHTYGEFADNNNVVVFSGSVVVGSDTTDDFAFKPTLNSPPTGVRGLAIRSVCIGDEGDGGPGGESGGDEGGGIITPSCGAIATPTGNAFNTWISWHWAQLNKFYRCQLLPLLQSLYKFLQKSWITVSWSMRWSQAATVKTVNWFGHEFVPWLGGHLSNIAVGQVTTITTAEQCGNVFCLLQSIANGFTDIVTTLLDGVRDIMEDVIGGLFDLLSTALNAIIDILNRLLNFVFSVLGAVVGIAVDIVGLIIQVIARAAELFVLLIEAVVMIVTAWANASPIDPGGILGSCALDQTSARCMFFYISERTIFTESGQYFMPVFAGGIYLLLLLWVIRRLTKALMDLGVLS